MTRLLWFAIAAVEAVFAFTISSPRYLRTASVEARPTSDGVARTPVLIELFTSEGCSDCPPADALLEKLDRTQPVSNAEVVVLSEHVNYWDDGGWRDPYSLQEVTTRQGVYASRFRSEGPYTPQMVIDGNKEFVGSDERKAVQAIENEAQVQKVPISLSAIQAEGESTLGVHVESGPLTPAKSADILLAVADDSDQSNVRHSENAGRNLTHVAVVRTLAKVGTIGPGVAFSKDLKMSTANTNHHDLRIIAFMQETEDGRVLGVGAARFLDSEK
jgi:hypothetical protein